MSEPVLTIEAAAGPRDMDTVRTLFLEYQDWLGADLCFQGFEAELARLPGCYAPPEGGLWFAKADRAIAGIVGVRPLEDKVCEMKRLWVRPAYRGLGLSRILAEKSLAAARAAGYWAMCLDTLGRMTAARALYRSLGFRDVPAYYDNPMENVRYLRLELNRGDEKRQG